MRKSDFMNKIRHLKSGAGKKIVERCEKMFDSGALDVDSYPDDYRLPRAIFCVVLYEWYKTSRPASMSDEIRKLKVRNVGKRRKAQTALEKRLNSLYHIEE